ncbi:hypothetical protein ACJJIQ_01490 [Microbulbifer sp. ANSA003]|uniref:hypothetical protein n=1 Tax=Microbulbifer sp. ANSA003 TaxID=3243360 RepID=UPI0040418E67
MTDLAISINELIKHTPREQRPGKDISTIYEVSKFYGTVGGAVKLAVEFGLTVTFAKALMSAVAGVAISSVPSLNEGYHSGPLDPVKNLANKTFSE